MMNEEEVLQTQRKNRTHFLMPRVRASMFDPYHMSHLSTIFPNIPPSKNIPLIYLAMRVTEFFACDKYVCIRKSLKPCSPMLNPEYLPNLLSPHPAFAVSKRCFFFLLGCRDGRCCRISSLMWMVNPGCHRRPRGQDLPN